MTVKNKKQFGVWMDSQHATVVGRNSIDHGEFVILGHVKNPGPDNNSDEKAYNNQEIGLTQKFFKEILSKMANVDEIHITGTVLFMLVLLAIHSPKRIFKNGTWSH